MQEQFGKDQTLLSSFVESLSSSRMETYLVHSGGVTSAAVALYRWNARISQSLYIYLQCWEVCLRNKLSDYFTLRHGASWPHEGKFIRNLKNDDRQRLLEAIERQTRKRRVCPIPTAPVVADLSAGFWVSQLSSAYVVPYAWRSNLCRVFPHDTTLDAHAAWRICDQLRALRNRIAHHEPIFHLPLQDTYCQLRRLVAAMCRGTSVFAETNCSFSAIWAERPACQKGPGTEPRH